MAGGACKVIINNGAAALSQGMEKVLTNPAYRAILTDKVADDMLDRLVHVDLRAVDGKDINIGLNTNMLAVLAELVDHGIVTDEVWRLYARPTNSPSL